MAASRPKRSVKQSLHPDFAYDFPGLISPTEIDAQVSPSGAARLTEHVSSTTPKVSKKSVKPSKIHDQLELERLKQHNLQLELQILTRKEKLAGVSDNMIQPQPQPHPQPHIPSTDTCGPIRKEPSQDKILASLMSDLTPPSHAELHQLTNPTFPVMHQLKANTKGPSVFSAKGTLEYDKLDISEFVFAFLEFIAQQPQSQHSDLMQYLRLLMKKPLIIRGPVLRTLICPLIMRWHKVDFTGVKWISFRLNPILSSVMGLSVPVRIQHPRFSGFAQSVILPG